ncbi:MAG: recombinase family protein [Flavobacteriaceae bacterium]
MLGIYCRISVDREGQKSIRLQQTLGKRFAKENNLDSQIYVDKGLSGGGKISNRPDFQRMLDDIENGTIDSVFVFDQDRLEREELTWYTLVNIIVENKAKLYENGKLVDLEDESVRLITGIKTMMNANFRRMVSKKIKEQLLINYEDGLVHGKPNFGYKKGTDGKMVLDEDEAEIVRKIYELNLNGWGHNRIKDYLIENRIPNRKEKKGKSWGKSSVGQILNNPLYKGIRMINGETYKSPVIIEPPYWNKVQKAKNPSGKGNNHKYLLNKTLKCEKCGSRYTGRYLTKVDNHYRCVTRQYKGFTCTNRGFRQTIIEQFIWDSLFVEKHIEDVIVKWFNEKPKNKLEEIEKKINGTKKQINKFKTQRSRANTLAVEGLLTPKELKEVKDRINNKLSDLEIILSNHEETYMAYKESSLTLDYLKKDLQIIFEGKVVMEITPEEKFTDDVHESASYNQKQEFIERWINTITIDYNKPTYTISIEYNIPNSPVTTYTCDTKYEEFKDDTGETIWLKNYRNMIPKF